MTSTYPRWSPCSPMRLSSFRLEDVSACRAVGRARQNNDIDAQASHRMDGRGQWGGERVRMRLRARRRRRT